MSQTHTRSVRPSATPSEKVTHELDHSNETSLESGSPAMAQHPLKTAQVVQMQRQIGNQAVMRLLRRPPVQVTQRKVNTIQREFDLKVNQLPDDFLLERTDFIDYIKDKIMTYVTVNLGITVKEYNAHYQKEKQEVTEAIRVLMAGYPQIGPHNPAIVRTLVSAFQDSLNTAFTHMETRRDRFKDFENTPMGEVKIGNEFTFTNDTMVQAVNEAKVHGDREQFKRDMSSAFITARDAWAQKMGELPTPIVPEEVEYAEGQPVGHEYKFTEQTVSWGYKVTMDDGVVEIITEPATGNDIVKGKIGQWMDQYIFNIADQVGLKAHKTLGSGHINIDRTTLFGGSENSNRTALLLRNFLAGFINDNPYWKESDPDAPNAPFPDEIEGGVDKIKGVLRGFDDAQAGEERRRWDLDKLTTMLLDAFKDLPSKVTQKRNEKPHYQALNVEHLKGEGERNRLEVRRVRAQESRDALIDNLIQIGKLMKEAQAASDENQAIELIENVVI